MPDNSEWIPVESDFEHVATHEAGHAVVGLSVGTKVNYVERLATNDVPEVLQAEGFHAGLAVNFTISFRSLEPRLQFLIAVGGIAAETLIFGKYDRGRAAADMDSLKPNVLSDSEIIGLIEIAQKILNVNLQYFNDLRKSLTKRLGSSDKILAVGASLNARFIKSGKKVDVVADLYRLLPE